MRFLCVPCDEPMKLLETKHPGGGSISLVYSCSACGYEFAMLTNPHETQLVSSLGIKMGAADSAAADPAAAGESKCPFTGMVQQMAGNAESPAQDGFQWTDAAQVRLATIPEFIRPMARSGIEKWAREQGYSQVDDKVLDEAKDFFGM